MSNRFGHLLRSFILVMILAAASSPALAALGLDYTDSDLWTRLRDCDAQGDTLATALEYGVQFWDMADPGAPVDLGTFYTETWRAYAVDLRDGLAAVTTLNGNLHILDATDPAAPVELSSLSSAGTSPDVLLRESGGTLMAYTAGNTYNGLQVHDLSDPANPVTRGSALITGLESVAALGDTLLALAVGAGLYSVDVSDPDNPSILDLDSMAGSFTNVTASGDLAVVAAKTTGFYVFDVSNPADPVELSLTVATVNPDFDNLTVMEVMLDGTLLYAVCNFAGPLLYDLADPVNPVLIGYDPALDSSSQAPFVAFRDGCIEGGRLYATHLDSEDAGIKVFDIVGADPLLLGNAAHTDFSRFAGISGDMMYSCNGDTGVNGFELVGNELQFRARMQLVRAWGVEAHGNIVYVASTDDGLVITDWIDPVNPVIVGALDMGQARAVRVHGDIAYVSAFTQGLHSIDISDPANPLLLDSETFDGMASAQLDIGASVVATADEGGGMNLWDVSDPSDILHLSNYPTAGKANDVAINGDIVYLVEKNAGVHIVDISDPTMPALLGMFDSGFAMGLELDPGKLYVASGTDGVNLYDLMDPLAPLLEASQDTPGTALALFSDDERLLVADDSGLTLITITNDLTAAGPTPLADGSFLAAFPNPFNPRTDLRFELAEAAELTLAVYDLSGRRLRTLAAGRLDAGTAQFTWDGKDDGGKGLASGVYFARLAGRELDSGVPVEAARKLVLIR
jgi:hypothetical protein